jgi:hypothetical protein
MIIGDTWHCRGLNCNPLFIYSLYVTLSLAEKLIKRSKKTSWWPLRSTLLDVIALTWMWMEILVEFIGLSGRLIPRASAMHQREMKLHRSQNANTPRFLSGDGILGLVNSTCRRDSLMISGVLYHKFCMLMKIWPDKWNCFTSRWFISAIFGFPPDFISIFIHVSPVFVGLMCVVLTLRAPFS